MTRFDSRTVVAPYAFKCCRITSIALDATIKDGGGLLVDDQRIPVRLHLESLVLALPRLPVQDNYTSVGSGQSNLRSLLNVVK